MSGEDRPGSDAGEQELAPGRTRIYVASLSDHHAGVRHGVQLEPAAGVTRTRAAIARMLDESPTAWRTGEPAEEWAIHEAEGFGPVRLAETEALRTVCLLAQGLEDHGEPFAAWWHLSQLDLADLEMPEGDDEELWHEELLYEITRRFEDQYRGEFDSLSDYGESVALDGPVGGSADLADYVTVDAERLAQDLVASGRCSILTTNNKVYVFDLNYQNPLWNEQRRV